MTRRFQVKARYRPDIKGWFLDYVNPAGQRRRLRAENEEMARRMQIKFTDWLIEGKDPEQEIKRKQSVTRAQSITLREFFLVFMQRHGDKQSKNTRGLYRGFFKNFLRCPQLVDRGLAEINKSLAADYVQARMTKDHVTPATANREVSLLRNILSRAVEWDILSHNPLAHYRMLREAEKREVLVSPEQITELVSCFEPVVADIIALLVYSGLRRENVLDLRIEQVSLRDLGGGCDVYLTVKGGKKRHKTLGIKAAEIIRRNIGTRTEGHIFLNPNIGRRYLSITKKFDEQVRKLGLKVNGTKLRIHDLRHVTASWLNQRGVPLDVIRVLLDHESRATTDRYASLDSQACGKVLDLLPEIRKMA